ncbi:hypothetical protein THO17_05690 [Marinomonas sp. THO17]
MDKSVLNKAPALLAAARRDNSLCTELTYLLAVDNAVADFEFSSSELLADKRFQYAKDLIKDRHQAQYDIFVAILRAYLVEEDFACRHPVYAAYFARRYQAQVNYQHCLDPVPFYLFDSNQGGHLVSINPQDVREIHLVFASEGRGVASSFGHVSVRLLVCPDASSSLQACQQNLFNHVFLGYVARIDGFTMNVLKGFFGGYDAHLFASTFREVFRANTLLADRDLYSLPLNLSAQQVEQIVRDLSEIHWSYRGNYRFITVNCATLLQDLLNEALQLENQSNEALGFLRPDSLFHQLRNSPLARGSELLSLDKAESKGYYFPRNRVYYQQALSALLDAIDEYPYASLEQYDQSRAAKRLYDLLLSDSVYNNLASNDYLLEAQLLLEERQLVYLRFDLFLKVVDIVIELQLLDVMQAKLKALPEGVDKQLLRHCYVLPLLQVQMAVPRFDGIPKLRQLADFQAKSELVCGSQQAQQKIFTLVASAVPDDHQGMKELKLLEQELVQTLDNIETLEGLF